MEHEVQRIEPSAVQVQGESEIGQLLRLAVTGNVPVETIEKLVALKERMEDRNAAREFNIALADFQAACPAIKKTSSAKITTAGGSAYSYSYAELDEIARTTRPILTRFGLSYTWDSEADGEKLICTCTVFHTSGHSRSAKFTLPTTTKSGMSDQQKVAAALTYARRQSLIQALGLTTTDPDTDGPRVDDKVTAEQVAELEKLVKETGADLSKLLAYLGVASLADITARGFDKAKKALSAKVKK